MKWNDREPKWIMQEKDIHKQTAIILFFELMQMYE